MIIRAHIRHRIQMLLLLFLPACTAELPSETPDRPEMSVTPGRLDFGEVVLGGRATLTVSVTNSGTAELTLSSLSASGAFELSDPPSMPYAVSPGSTLDMEIVFEPDAVGAATGSLSIISDDAGVSEGSVSLTGTALPPPTPEISVAPTELAFGDVDVGQERTLPLTVTSSGTADLTLSALSTSGDFQLVGAPTLPHVVEPGGTTDLEVVFRPGAAGAVTGGLSIVSDARTGELSLPLRGAGIRVPTPEITITPEAIEYGEVEVGGSRLLSATITSSGDADLTISGLDLESPDGVFRPFAPVTLPIVLEPGESFEWPIGFEPPTAAVWEGAFVVSSDAAGAPTARGPLRGTGVAAPTPELTATPSSIDFGEVEEGSSATRPVTLENTGAVAVTITLLGLQTLNGFSLSGAPALPVLLEPGGTLVAEISFAPDRSGAASTPLSVLIASMGPPALQVPLTGTGVPGPPPQLTATPAELDFGEVLVGERDTVTVAIANVGTREVRVTSISRGAGGSFNPFFVDGPPMPLVLAPGASTVADVFFTPFAAYDIAGTVTVEVDQVVALEIPTRGRGVEPQITITPRPLDFGDVVVGSRTTARATIANSGSADLTVSELELTDPTGVFSVTDAPRLPFAIAPGAAVDVGLAFQPMDTGAASATLSVRSDAADEPNLPLPLSGTGVPGEPRISVTPASPDVGEVELGTERSLVVTVSNSGTADLTLQQIQVLLPGSEFRAEFRLENPPSTPVTLEPGRSVQIEVVFTPTELGVRTNSLRIFSDAVDFPLFATQMRGTGVAPADPWITVAPAELAFGTVTLGGRRSLTVTITNSGAADLTVSGLALSGGGAFSLDGGARPPVILSPGATLDVSVVFRPTEEGAVTGTLRVESDAANGAGLAVALSGSGVLDTAHRMSRFTSASC